MITRSRSLSAASSTKPTEFSPRVDLEIPKAKSETKRKPAQNMSQQPTIPEKVEAPKNEDKWMDMFNKLNSTLMTLSTEVTQLKDLKGKVDSYSETWKKTVDSFVETSENAVVDQDLRIKWLTNIVIRQEQKIEELENKLENIKAREQKPNLTVTGILEDPEESRETLIQKSKDFIKNQMEIEQNIEIWDAYRLGQPGAVTRTVFIKLRYPSDKTVIFTNASNLKGKMNAKRKLFFVRDETSEEQQEIRKYYQQLQKENKECKEEKKLKIHMARNKLMVNNSIIRKKIMEPKNADLLRMENQELEQVRAMKMV